MSNSNDLEENIETVNDFDKMGISDSLLRGIYAYGFEKPSKIQEKAIVPIIGGTDIIAQSQSGTGKTGAFTISTLQRVDESIKDCQALIVVPTRELAFQIFDVCKNVGQYLKIKPVLAVGGSDIKRAKRELEHCCSIVIGTPGRIIDMMNRRFLNVKNIKLLVLDEADEMLSNSFVVQIQTIVTNIPKTAQICLFSATMPKEVLDITTQFMLNPKYILVKQEELTLDGIKQFYIDVQREDYKFDTFCDLYGVISISQSMVYVNKKRKAEWLVDRLKENNFTVSVIHSDMIPTERSRIMKEFRNGSTRILISTDLLSRGIDVQQVSIVVNYDIPDNKESYLHRIGRSGRFGRKGVAINFVTDYDFYKLTELKSFYKTDIEPMPANIAEFM